jgi:CDP-diacylglycerol--serine O-phosphatidyltransferase
VASAVWLGYDLGYTTTSLPFVLVITMAFLTAVVSFLMIANVRYHSFKGINFSRRVSVAALLLFILLIGLIATDPPKVLFLLACSYAFSGPMASLWRRLSSKR